MSRVYDNIEDCISECRRNVSELGTEVKLKTYQNIVIENDDNFVTKELIGESFKLTNNVTSEKVLDYISQTKGEQWYYFCRKEFLERISSEHVNPGISMKALKDEYWEKFLNKSGKHDYTYNERIRSQIDLVVEELRRDNGTRRAVLSIWNPTIDNANSLREIRVPCSMYYQFLVRDGRLEVIYTMRSSDVMSLLDVDIFMTLSLREFVAKKLGLENGNSHFFIGSMHAYKKDLGAKYF